MAFTPCHVWVEMVGGTYKVVFKADGRPSHIMKWAKAWNRSGGSFTRYWSSTSGKSKPGTLSARIIAEAEKLRGV